MEHVAVVAWACGVVIAAGFVDVLVCVQEIVDDHERMVLKAEETAAKVMSESVGVQRAVKKMKSLARRTRQRLDRNRAGVAVAATGVEAAASAASGAAASGVVVATAVVSPTASVSSPATTASSSSSGGNDSVEPRAVVVVVEGASTASTS